MKHQKLTGNQPGVVQLTLYVCGGLNLDVCMRESVWEYVYVSVAV